MRIAFLGTGEFGGPTLRALIAAGHEVALVISQPDRPAGRGRALAPTPIRQVAEELGLRHVQSENINALPAEMWDGIELGFVVAFGQKLAPELLGRVERGFVNLHASLLPKYRGAAPYQWAILNGERETGVTIFELNERWDAGAILSQRSTVIGESETADELHDRLGLLGAELAPQTVADIARGIAQRTPQDPTLATRAPKLTRQDRQVNWALPAHQVARRINGLWSWPSATCNLRDAKGGVHLVQLARARAAADGTFGAPGSFTAEGAVACSEGAVEILEIRPAGRKRMAFSAFVNGCDVRPPAQMLPAELS